MSDPAVVVVGAGIAGLAAALRFADGGARVTVLEGSDRLGGKLARARVAGVDVDTGAESLLARRPEALALVDRLGLTDRLVYPTDAKPQVLSGGRLHPLPPWAMGVPTDLDALTGLLSEAGLARAREEPALAAPPLTGDRAIGVVVADRFGDEVTDRLLEPLLGGVYAGNSRELSFAATSPKLWELARCGGSLLEHARTSTATTAAGPVFAALVGGVATLVDALAGALRDRGVRVRTGVPVRELRRGGAGWRLTCGSAAAPEAVDTSAVVLAVPAAPAGRLLAPLAGPAARAYAAIPYASMAVVILVVRGAEPGGSGLLIPPSESATIKAVTYSSNKWAWVGESAKRAYGQPMLVARVSVGRRGEERLLQISDEELVRRTFAEATRLPEWADAALVGAGVQRWGGGLPQYLVGHRELVAALRDELSNLSGIAVCGAALDGVGIAPCVGTADAAADKVRDDLAVTAG